MTVEELADEAFKNGFVLLPIHDLTVREAARLIGDEPYLKLLPQILAKFPGVTPAGFWDELTVAGLESLVAHGT